MKEWTLKSSGFQSEALATYPVTTGTNGLGELRFTPEREGYYALSWESPDVWSVVPGRFLTNRIRAEAVIWGGFGRWGSRVPRGRPTGVGGPRLGARGERRFPRWWWWRSQVAGFG